MVLTADSLASVDGNRNARWVPVVLTWMLLASVIAVFAWSLLSNPKPGPYGVCYASNRRAVPCK